MRKKIITCPNVVNLSIGTVNKPHTVVVLVAVNNKSIKLMGTCLATGNASKSVPVTIVAIIERTSIFPG
jgi:hypothetical protein